jgi:hypothetical protein
LVSIAFLALSSIVFSLANVNERLKRIETKLDLIGRPQDKPGVQVD